MVVVSTECMVEFRLKTYYKSNISYITDTPENQYGLLMSTSSILYDIIYGIPTYLNEPYQNALRGQT